MLTNFPTELDASGKNEVREYTLLLLQMKAQPKVNAKK